MLVSELRELLKKYKEDDLRLIVTELYKSIPKKMREDKDIDELLKDVHTTLRIGKTEKTQNKQIDFVALKPKVDLFLDYAYKQYYFAPNSYVHKKERPKWRFIVKGFINDLQTIPLEDPQGKTATDLLVKLYEMLSYACAYYIFNTENPFSSVGIGQSELLDIVVKRMLGNGIDKESVKTAIKITISSYPNRNTVTSLQISTLVSNFKSTDFKEIAIEQAKALKEELVRQSPNPKKKPISSNLSEYEREEKINNLVETVFKLYISLCEYDKAIQYFNSNYIEWNKEVNLYILLDMLIHYRLKEHWLSVYESAVKKGINPRGALQKTYQYIRENNELPDYILH